MGKEKNKITNWASYKRALMQRGSVIFWIDDSAVDAWTCTSHHGKRGRGFLFSDTAIETALLSENGVSFSPTALQDESDLELLVPPCLLHWNLNHFVLVT